jgi:hypothetical protein
MIYKWLFFVAIDANIPGRFSPEPEELERV